MEKKSASSILACVPSPERSYVKGATFFFFFFLQRLGVTRAGDLPCLPSSVFSFLAAFILRCEPTWEFSYDASRKKKTPTVLSRTVTRANGENQVMEKGVRTPPSLFFCFFFFFCTLLLSSLRTIRRHRCRPFFPPVLAFNFLLRIGFSNPTARRFFIERLPPYRSLVPLLLSPSLNNVYVGKGL